MSQKQLAALIGLHLALGLPLPEFLSYWDGRNIDTFTHFKSFFKKQ